MAEELVGIVVSYVRGPRTQSPRECLIHFPAIESAGEAAQLIGSKVAWPAGERKCLGKVVSLHGKRGLVRVRFRKGLPGDALGSQVRIVG
ncbi:MAG: 50S ribosomal protein L35ae [Candidatus Bathyarchaeota archaeon]|nr:50S ribosomal protein L35ae [Candidatus Bathyarchaeota archaeon]